MYVVNKPNVILIKCSSDINTDNLNLVPKTMISKSDSPYLIVLLIGHFFLDNVSDLFVSCSNLIAFQTTFDLGCQHFVPRSDCY